MPKGVEHEKTLVVNGVSVTVILALMPKGVEHSGDGQWNSGTNTLVILALMPKGVEHQPPTHADSTTSCDSCLDAERR